MGRNGRRIVARGRSRTYGIVADVCDGCQSTGFPCSCRSQRWRGGEEGGGGLRTRRRRAS
jgi:hypothetical protein